MTTVGIGVIGAGSIARGHARAIEETTGDVVAVADVDPEARSAFAGEFDVPNAYEDYETMLDDAPLDAVLVSVPNDLHAPCATAALDRDVDVLVEKPLARTLEEARTIRRAEADSDGTVMVGFTMTFREDVDAVTRWHRAGEFGDVYDVDLTYVRRRGIPRFGSWFTREAVAGGGALVDVGVHLLSAAMYVLDYPDVESISATVDAHFGSDPDDYVYTSMWGGDPVEDPVFDVDDTVRAFVRLADGPTLELDVAWASNRAGEKSIDVLGDDAGASIDLDDGEATVFGTAHGDLTETDIGLADAHPFVTEWEYFLDVVTGDREHTRCTVERGVAIQRLLDAIARSSERGEEVRLDGSRS